MPNHMHAVFGIVETDVNRDKHDGGNPTVGAYGDTPTDNTPSKPLARAYGNTPTDNTPSKPFARAYGDTPLRDGESTLQSPSKTVGAIVRGYKSAVTTKINRLNQTSGQKIWQRNYYEHIIRNDKSLNRIQDYIINNPAQWEDDMNHPQNVKKKTSS